MSKDRETQHLIAAYMAFAESQGENIANFGNNLNFSQEELMQLMRLCKIACRFGVKSVLAEATPNE